MAQKINKVTYGKNVYDKKEIKAVVNTLKKTTQMGNNVYLFEKKISKAFGKKYGVMVNSGTSAIAIALRLLDLNKNDEIITPCLNFGTALSSIILNNCKPILVDINIQTLQINEEEIESKITPKTKALMIPNLIGNLPNWKKISKIAKKNKLKVIEDSADTLGSKINQKPSGKFSDISITSFYGSHIISCAGNGGMIMFDKNNYKKRAKILRSWGRLSSINKDSENINKRLKFKLQGVPYDNKFVFSEIGFNFEPSEIGASFGLVQLSKFKKFEKIRKLNFKLHEKFFNNYKNFFIPIKVNKNVSTNFLAYPIIIKENNYFNRNELQIYLEKHNIQTRPIFSGNILRHPAFISINKYNKVNSFKNSDYIMKNGMLIGCHQGLKYGEIKFIHNTVKNFIKIKII